LINNNTNESLVGFTIPQIKNISKKFSQPDFRAEQIYKWIHNGNCDDFDEMTNIPKDLRQFLKKEFKLKTLKLIIREKSIDGTEKFLWELTDRRRIESVLIPDIKRITLCISSQVGCALGCHFCATAQMGFIRNLTVGEIVEQVLMTKKLIHDKITNVVFMGMGEPFLNYNRVIQASHILRDPLGLAVSSKKITISSSGIIPPIYQFSKEQQPFALAISLHAPTQQLRNELMPLAKKFPLDALIESVVFYLSNASTRRITFEYVLLENINDGAEHAQQLLKLLSPLRCKLNIIPCNENDFGFRPSSKEKIEEFMKILSTGLFTLTLRRNRGQDITAACGQLYANSLKKDKPRFLQINPIET
jgi:23S rRNA (adenine2503-C2)-methyltransferase